MRVESPSSPRERRSVSTVRRSIIFMRDSNCIKKNEKYIPHFRRTVPYSEWGRKARREGGGATFPARRTLNFTLEHDETRRKGVINTSMSEDSTLSRREGGGATFPARRELYFIFEYDETRRKGVTTLPCQGQSFTRREGKTGQKVDGNENFTPCGRGVGTFRDFVGICRLIAENGVLASRAGGADGA